MAAKFRFPLKRSPKSDPQQYRVYRMENEAIGARSYAKLTRDVMHTLSHSVCRNYHVPRVKLQWCDLGRWAAEWEDGTIRLNTKKGTAKDILTLTHELAHHLHYYLGGVITNDHEAHGPEFMACHISILDTLRVIPVVGMRAICDAWKVRYVDPGTSTSWETLQKICTRKPG